MKPSTLTRSLRDLGPSALCSGLVRRFRRVIHHFGELMLSVFGKTIRAGEDEHGVAAAIGVAIYPLDAEHHHQRGRSRLLFLSTCHQRQWPLRVASL